MRWLALLLLLFTLDASAQDYNVGTYRPRAAGGGGGGTPTFVRIDQAETVDASSPYTGSVTIGAAVSANDTIIVFCAVYDGSESTPNTSTSDSVNGAYTEHGNQADSTGMNIEVGSVIASAGTPTVTCTSDQTSGTAYFRVAAVVVTNLDTGGSRFLDATSANGTSSTMTVGDITPGAGSNRFYVSGTASYPPSGDNVGTLSPPASWTSRYNDNSSATTLAFGVAEYLNSGTQAQTWGNTVTATWVGIGAAFAPEP